MSEKQMTFEEIEQHLKSVDWASYEQGVSKSSTEGFHADPGATLQKVCGIYKKIRPILKAVTQIPLIPDVIKAPIRIFIGVLDQLCP